MILKRIVKGISTEVSNFLISLRSTTTCSRQSFSVARQKFSHTAFIELNKDFVSGLYSSSAPLSYYKDEYILIAVDGSLLQLPEEEALATHFGRWKNQYKQSMPMLRASVVYDVLNRIILNSKFSPLEESENELIRTQHGEYKSLNLPKTALFLMDRKYPSYDLCKRIDSQEDKFVIRCRKNLCKSVRSFVASGQEEATITLQPVAWYTTKGGKKESEFSGELPVRILRIVLEGGELEYLLTNLEASREELTYLYNLRWGVETIYDYLKNVLEIENVSSKKTEGVLQDFYASILTCNLIHLLIKEAEEEIKEEDKDQPKKEKKYEYQINRATAAGILRQEIIQLLFSGQDIENRLKELKNHIKRDKTAIIPNRKFKRYKMKRSRRKYHFSKKRAL